LGASNPFWTRVFAFGDQNGSGAENTGLDYCHYAGGNYQNLNFQTGAGSGYANNPAGLNGVTNVHVTVVVDPLSINMYYFNVSNPGALLAVHLTSPDNPLTVNENSQQVFTGDFANVTNVNLAAYGGATFTSGNTAVFTVNSSNGLVQAIAPGTTTLVASFGGLKATNTLTVVSVPATLTHRY